MSKKLVKAGLLGGAIALLSATTGVQAQTSQASATDAQAAADSLVPVRKLTAIKTAMRDGANLVSDVYLPEAEGKYPVILIRSPYRMRNGPMADTILPLAQWFAGKGYAVVVQDVRGTGDSDGTFDFLPQEPKDGYDSIESLAVQPWANGKLCMMGYSYLGAVQWLAAKEMPPHLTCMAPTAATGALLDEVPAIGGAFMTQFGLQWPRMVLSKEGRSGGRVDWNALLQKRPLLTLADDQGEGPARLYRKLLEHDTLDEYWKPAHLTNAEIARVNIPIMETTGWFDGDQPGELFYWRGIESRATPSPDQFLVIGPWVHAETFNGGHEKQGKMLLSKDSIIDNRAMHLAFFDHYLKGTAPKPDWPRVRLFITGANEWRTFSAFPPKEAKLRPFYLSSGGKANSLSGDGTLSWEKPGKQAADKYTFDPHNPVPLGYGDTFGGDRTDVHKRPDVLVYTSTALAKPVEIIGEVAVELYAATDARDTDFTASVSDVAPDGTSIVLGSRPVGIIRARYRNGPMAKPSLLTPGKVEKYRVNLQGIGHRFLPGHRIRVEVSSGAYPMFTPNQNTGNPIATDTEWKVAKQTIFHDSIRPSAILLPVVDD
ncbi:MAG: CocE/NonD family hydrolase [Sphingomonas sp.]